MSGWISWPWEWADKCTSTITESQAARIQAEAAAKGQVTTICARVVPDPEPEAQ